MDLIYKREEDEGFNLSLVFAWELIGLWPFKSLTFSALHGDTACYT